MTIIVSDITPVPGQTTTAPFRMTGEWTMRNGPVTTPNVFGPEFVTGEGTAFIKWTAWTSEWLGREYVGVESARFEFSVPEAGTLWLTMGALAALAVSRRRL